MGRADLGSGGSGSSRSQSGIASASPKARARAAKAPRPFLSTLAGWFKSEPDRPLGYKLLRKAEALSAKSDTLDKHFLYQAMLEIAYRDFSTPAGREMTVRACQLQIALAPKAVKAFARENPGQPLVQHRGYERLASIAERDRDYEEAIRLYRQAEAQGWAGDWQERVRDCEERRSRFQRK